MFKNGTLKVKFELKYRILWSVENQAVNILTGIQNAGKLTSSKDPEKFRLSSGLILFYIQFLYIIDKRDLRERLLKYLN